MYRIEFIDHKSKFLEDVISLGNRNSSTLGFLPIGGFQEHARKKWIIIIQDNNELLGYLLYRIGSKNFKVSITHLCVNPDHRGKQIAIMLLDQLKEKYKQSLTGISLNCRKDYKEASRLWAKYGFVSRTESRSRSFEENYLVKWWYDFNKSDLFSFLEQNSPKIKVLLDANIIIKHRDEHIEEHSQIKALFADWVSEEIDYYFAPEIFNEIHRDGDRNRAENTRKFIQKVFKEARFDRDECNKIIGDLSIVLTGASENDSSDRKQLAECISSSIEYFVTGDSNILSKRSDIQEKFDITILDPLEFLLEIDKISNKASYHPVRLSGASQTTQKVDNIEIEKLIEKFWNQKLQESKTHFKSLVSSVLTEVPTGNIKTVKCSEKGVLAFWGYTTLSDSIEVSFLRTVENSLSNTLFIQLIHELISEAILQEKPLINIQNDHFSDSHVDILISFGFYKKANIWVKIAISCLIESSGLLQQFPILKSHFEKGFLENIISMPLGELKTKCLYEIERKLYPLKFSDLDIPSYIIPIKPIWAGQLFDKFISSSNLFGADPNKIWNRENIYYRNIKPVTEKFPARILWYLSTEEGFYRQNGIVAISYLDEVTIGQVKKQFNKFKKYGTYEWKDVFHLAKSDITKDIKVIKFSDTEVFPNVLNFSEVTKILIANNRKKNTFTSPLEVNKKIFNEVYRFFLT